MGINQDFKNNLAWNKQEKNSENASSNLSEILYFSLFILGCIGAIMQTQTLHSLSASLERRPPSPAEPVRAFNIDMETIFCIGMCRSPASLHSSWSMQLLTRPLESETGSPAVGQGQISPSKPAEWRLRMLEFIIATKVKKLLAQWFSPEHKPPSPGGPAAHMCWLCGEQAGRVSESV